MAAWGGVVRKKSMEMKRDSKKKGRRKLSTFSGRKTIAPEDYEILNRPGKVGIPGVDTRAFDAREIGISARERDEQDHLQTRSAALEKRGGSGGLGKLSNSEPRRLEIERRNMEKNSLWKKKRRLRSIVGRKRMLR